MKYFYNLKLGVFVKYWQCLIWEQFKAKKKKKKAERDESLQTLTDLYHPPKGVVS